MLDNQSNFMYRLRMTATPVPAGFHFTWSYSSINTFSICPRKWWAEKVSRTAVWEENAAASWGTAVHEQLEHRAQDGAPMPSNMSMFQPALDKVRALAAVSMAVHYEHKMGLTRDGAPCDFDAPEMFGRSIADVFGLLSQNVAYCADWKTGRYYGPTLQPVVNARLIFAHFPEVTEVKTSWAYLKEGVTHREDFKREDIISQFSAVQVVIDQMQTAIEHQNFPARRNFLCRNYCSDFSCPHNGRRGPATRMDL